MSARAFLLAALLTLAPAAGGAMDFRNTPDEQLTGPLEAALMAYRDQRATWPSSVDELRRFAEASGKPLDLSAFSTVSLTRTSAGTIFVGYVTMPPESAEGGFAITVVDVVSEE